MIDNRPYAPIFVLGETYRTSKTTLNTVLRIFEVSCIVEYAFKIPSNDIS